MSDKPSYEKLSNLLIMAAFATGRLPVKKFGTFEEAVDGFIDYDDNWQ